MTPIYEYSLGRIFTEYKEVTIILNFDTGAKELYGYAMTCSEKG